MMFSEHSDSEKAARFEAEQDDLDSLCANRPLQTLEAWPENDYYGIASTLRRYAGVPSGRSIKAVVPHGVYMNDHLLADAERNALLPAALVFPPYREALYRNPGGMVVVPSAAPFVYASRLINAPAERRGTLYYPTHSLPGVAVKMDFDAIAEELLGWPEHMKPVSVSVYWHDYLLGNHLPFTTRGIRVVSAGHMFDPDFLLRQAHLLKQHKYVASNSLGSHAFYATHAGCLFLLVEQQYAYSGSEEDIAAKIVSALSSERLRARRYIRKVFSVVSDHIDDERLRISDYHLGTKFALQPEQLADLIDWLDRLDRFGGSVLVFDCGKRFGVSNPRLGYVPRQRQRSRENEIRLHLDWLKEGEEYRRAVETRRNLEERLSAGDYEHTLRDYVRSRQAFSGSLKFYSGLAAGMLSRRLLRRLLTPSRVSQGADSSASEVVNHD